MDVASGWAGRDDGQGGIRMSAFGFVSPLFVPADRPERFAKAASSGADAVILDLEDAVAPEAKVRAREALRTDFTDLPVIVRINAPGTPWHETDREAAAELPLTAVMIPKSAAGEAFDAACRAIPHPIIALVESAAGLATARELAALPSVARLAFGSIDFAADLGVAHSRQTLLPARFELALASRLASLPLPVDGVTTAIDDAALIQDDARHGRELGFGGKLCIHPRQIVPVIAGFAPSEAELEWARRVVASGEGASLVDGAMVDEPVRIRARAVLARRIALERRDGSGKAASALGLEPARLDV